MAGRSVKPPDLQVGTLARISITGTFSLGDYLELLDWSARQTVLGKRGATSADAPLDVLLRTRQVMHPWSPLDYSVATKVVVRAFFSSAPSGQTSIVSTGFAWGIAICQSPSLKFGERIFFSGKVYPLSIRRTRANRFSCGLFNHDILFWQYRPTHLQTDDKPGKGHDPNCEDRITDKAQPPQDIHRLRLQELGGTCIPQTMFDAGPCLH